MPKVSPADLGGEPDPVNALTLWQPWASLIAYGVKRIETRSWKAPADLIGDTIAIHAAARDTDSDVTIPMQCWDALGEHIGGAAPPRGAIVATARLTACLPMVPWNDPEQRNGEHRVFVGPGVLSRTAERGPALNISDQLPYGDFAPGRWAWMLDDIARVEDRCPWCGGDSHDPNGHMGELCPLCAHPGTEPHERGRLPGPIPAKGRQRVWRWTP